MTARCPLHPRLRKILDDSGVEWSCLSGGKHWKLYIEGEMVQVVSRGGREGRQHDNSLACVRRAIRRMTGR